MGKYEKSMETALVITQIAGIDYQNCNRAIYTDVLAPISIGHSF